MVIVASHVSALVASTETPSDPFLAALRVRRFGIIRIGSEDLFDVVLFDRCPRATRARITTASVVNTMAPNDIADDRMRDRRVRHRGRTRILIEAKLPTLRWLLFVGQPVVEREAHQLGA